MKYAYLAAGVIALAFATNVSAATPAAAPSPETQKRDQQYFKRSDVNGDGVISKEEFTAKALKRFDQIDANHDGKIAADEMSGYRAAKKAKSAKRKAERMAAKKAASAAPAQTPEVSAK